MIKGIKPHKSKHQAAALLSPALLALVHVFFADLTEAQKQDLVELGLALFTIVAGRFAYRDALRLSESPADPKHNPQQSHTREG